LRSLPLLLELSFLLARLAKENWRGDANVLEFLVSCGARINGHQEERPLVCAAQSGNIPMLRGLLDAWTSIGSQNSEYLLMVAVACLLLIFELLKHTLFFSARHVGRFQLIA